MERIIGYCGLVCSDCSAYIATQANDRAALEEVAARWREKYNAPNMTVESVVCDGCLGGKKVRHCGNWFECQIRACGMARDVANCGHCDDYACDKLQAFFQIVPDARTVLDAVRSSL